MFGMVLDPGLELPFCIIYTELDQNKVHTHQEKTKQFLNQYIKIKFVQTSQHYKLPLASTIK